MGKMRFGSDLDLERKKKLAQLKGGDGGESKEIIRKRIILPRGASLRGARVAATIRA
jgi:hypothetical protein